MNFAELDYQPLGKNVTYLNPLPVTMHHPAMLVMTDLEKVNAVTIAPKKSIDEAKRIMTEKGIRMLLVTDKEKNILGLITMSHLSGAKPMQHIMRFGGMHKDVTVENVMTPHSRLDALDLKEVLHARVGDIVATMNAQGRRHALVVERKGPLNEKHLRGLFSATQIALQLETELQIFEIAHTFSEIARVTRVPF